MDQCICLESLIQNKIDVQNDGCQSPTALQAGLGLGCLLPKQLAAELQQRTQEKVDLLLGGLSLSFPLGEGLLLLCNTCYTPEIELIESVAEVVVHKQKRLGYFAFGACFFQPA